MRGSADVMERAKQWAGNLKRDVVALWIAARDPRTPWYAKAAAGIVAAYALSPIDLIPDFIPILGYLDELFILPIGIALTVRLIPADLMAEFRRTAASRERRPYSTIAAVVVVSIWMLALSALAHLAYQYAL
ncbi:putative transmembrane protein (plasmid) [Sinorhizobium fredii HH103]|uniref:Transmembrane protein n=2 Tax=Rhizobium fredii TaxID=380 RepID=G9AGB0_SINF1|nr:putative transmembrane protein [Sinorhizobium fredii HH103]